MVHFTGDDPMSRATEALVKLFVFAAKLLRLHDIKAEQAIAQLQAIDANAVAAAGSDSSR